MTTQGLLAETSCPLGGAGQAGEEVGVDAAVEDAAAGTPVTLASPRKKKSMPALISKPGGTQMTSIKPLLLPEEPNTGNS